jgi:hypothetical protein
VIHAGSEPFSRPEWTVGCSMGALEPMDRIGDAWTGWTLVVPDGWALPAGSEIAPGRCQGPCWSPHWWPLNVPTCGHGLCHLLVLIGIDCQVSRPMG